jgi:phosphohistidine phosphatase
MTRELLILRHGKSDWEAGTDDFHRPLKDRGKRAAQRVGVWLLQQGLLPDHVVSSPAERASVTAEKACKAMGLNARMIHREQAVYEAMTGELLQVLASCPASAQRVMLVGHNPGLEELLIYLAHESIAYPADGKLLPTATVAKLAMPDDWQGLHAGSARLLSITRPGELPRQFPFPFPDGPERRDRPAYYYTQSSVIPYRLHDGRPEILLVSSSQRKHWVVPKGIRDPGLTPQESAAKEAWEEAGVEGQVAKDALGSYRYEKWGATCTVDVFPMEVTRTIPEDEWEERHRGREWVAPEVAQRRLRQAELKPLVAALVSRLQAG